MKKALQKKIRNINTFFKSCQLQSMITFLVIIHSALSTNSWKDLILGCFMVSKKIG